MTHLRRTGALGVAAVLLFAGVGCSEEPPADSPAASCSVPPEVELPDGIPPDFPWPDGVALTEARSTKKFVALEGFAQGSVEDYFESAAAVLDDKEFDIINTDFEGFEAELYFAKGDSLAGITSLREGPCDGYVKVNVVYDPLETAEGREAVRKTRKLSGEGGGGKD